MWQKIEDKYISPIFGPKVWSKDQSDNLFKVLDRTTLTFNDWIFLIGRLRSFGFSVEEQFYVIDKWNRWKTYDKHETIYQLRYFYKYKQHIGDSGRDLNPSFLSRPPAPIYTDVEIIKLFLDNTEPWKVKPPKSIKEAALYYYYEGAHVIPMGEPKRPAIPWQEYQDRQPTLKEMASWNWNNGVLLLGDKERCYLDIDFQSPAHPHGMANLNMDILDGYRYEITRNGGLHVFGYGNLPLIKGEACEIKSKGGYIVTAPTSGYAIA